MDLSLSVVQLGLYHLLVGVHRGAERGMKRLPKIF